MPCADPEGVAGGPDPLKNHKNIGFLSNTGPDPIKNHKATKPAFKVGPSSARQRNAISMAFRWWADDGPLLVDLDPLSPHQLKTKEKKIFARVRPPLTKLSGSAHECCQRICGLIQYVGVWMMIA